MVRQAHHERMGDFSSSFNRTPVKTDIKRYSLVLSLSLAMTFACFNTHGYGERKSQPSQCDIAKGAANDPIFTEAVKIAKAGMESAQADADGAVAYLNPIKHTLTGDIYRKPIVQHTINAVKAMNDVKSAYQVALKAAGDAKSAVSRCDLSAVNEAKINAENAKFAAERATSNAAASRKAARTAVNNDY